MSWIIRDAVARHRARLGMFHGDDWERCAGALGLRVIVTDLGPLLPAMLIDGRLIISRRVEPDERARWAWHEIGHHLLHAGNCEFWRSRPQGEITVAKFERQAWEFALTFPVWD